MNILSVKITNSSLREVLEKVHDFLHSGQHQIATVNPEFIMAAQKDDEFRSILNKCDLNVADGFGIALAARRTGERLVERITGVDLLWEIIQTAERESKMIFLLGAKKGVADECAAKITERFPQAKIVGAESGYRHWHRHFSDEKLVEMINRRQPDILFVAFGQVKQEKWIYHNLPKMPSVKLAMGVGGSFDYISGRIKRAPQWMRKLGLEWLFRVIRQPWRTSRIITAVMRFGFAAIIKKQHEV